MDRTAILTDSKYIRKTRELKLFSRLSVAFLFCLFVLPQYFGLPFPLFDLTALRIVMILWLIFILGEKQSQKQFIELIVKEPFSKVLIPYLIVLLYTMVLRVDFNALLNPLIELIGLYMLIYAIKYVLGIKKTMQYIIYFTYLLVFLGLVEYVIQTSPFAYLETIKGTYTGRFIRSGHYRIMGPAVHSLGYGLLLITVVPIICYDMEKEEINILRHKLLLLLVTINIFFTGSRSTLSIFLLELLLLALFSTKTNIKRLIIIGSVFITAFTTVLVVFHNTSFVQGILLQLTSVIDELMGTTYSLKYGADMNALVSSSNYREQLKYIFQVDWLNPLLGIGRKNFFSCEINGTFIRSVDSFYIAEFTRYAYPGMVCFIIYLLYFLLRMIKKIRRKSQINTLLFIGSLCYCINLLWVDSLQTLKYLYILFAIFCCLPDNKDETKQEYRRKKIISKYIL